MDISPRELTQCCSDIFIWVNSYVMKDISIREERFRFIAALSPRSHGDKAANRVNFNWPMLYDSDESHESGEPRAEEEH